MEKVGSKDASLEKVNQTNTFLCVFGELNSFDNRINFNLTIKLTRDSLREDVDNVYDLLKKKKGKYTIYFYCTRFLTM